MHQRRQDVLTCRCQRWVFDAWNADIARMLRGQLPVFDGV